MARIASNKPLQLTGHSAARTGSRTLRPGRIVETDVCVAWPDVSSRVRPASGSETLDHVRPGASDIRILHGVHWAG